MESVCIEQNEITVLVNPVGKEQTLLDFLEAKNICATRKIVVEPPDMYTVTVGRDMLFKAFRAGLHVDKDEDPKRILIFSSDKDKLQSFLIQHALIDVSIERCDGETDVEYRCPRLSKTVEYAAVKAGLLVGRTSFQPQL